MTTTSSNQGSDTHGNAGVAPRRIKLRHMWPLVGFVVPTLVLGYGVVIPRSCIAGVNELTIGFFATVVGACVTYVMGVKIAVSD